MRIEIAAKDYKVSDRLDEIIRHKINKLDRYFNDNAEVKVLCKKERDLYKMEVNITAKGVFYRAEVSSLENMYINIDLALPKIEKQIVKNKEKMASKFKSDAFAKSGFEFVDDTPELYKESKIVKHKSFEVEELSEEDAMFMLEATDHNFYIYLNAETGKVNVIYRRNDGNYGNIEVK